MPVRGEGGGSIFPKCQKFKNVSSVLWGEGEPYLEHCPKFSRFFSDASPNVVVVFLIVVTDHIVLSCGQ